MSERNSGFIIYKSDTQIAICRYCSFNKSPYGNIRLAEADSDDEAIIAALQSLPEIDASEHSKPPVGLNIWRDTKANESIGCVIVQADGDHHRLSVNLSGLVSADLMVGITMPRDDAFTSLLPALRSLLTADREKNALVFQREHRKTLGNPSPFAAEPLDSIALPEFSTNSPNVKNLI